MNVWRMPSALLQAESFLSCCYHYSKHLSTLTLVLQDSAYGGFQKRYCDVIKFSVVAFTNSR